MTDLPATPEPAAVLSTIVGDRACASCGFNLYGQPIAREEHYNLIVARCPECGTVAALQEYPALGKWSRRWSAVLAALWLALLLLVFAGTTMMTVGLSIVSVEIASEPAGNVLTAEYNHWVESLDEERSKLVTPSIYYGTTTYSQWDSPDPGWAYTDDPRALLDAHGGLWASADRSVTWLWVVMSAVAVPFAIFWSLALLHQKPWRAVVVPVVSIFIAGSLFYAVFRAELSTSPSFDDMTMSIYAPVIGTITLGIMLVSLIAWCLAARPLARLVVRMALPPRMRAPFGVLWSSAGKPMPRPR
ncbi:MAG: hypothetical protein DHS20C14_13580 [Phycisphaeraceae bacterium]|nr:MAG: hypothetical protein DHS20C14_13580 [Phycisphaeraceae bacterium]